LIAKSKRTFRVSISSVLNLGVMLISAAPMFAQNLQSPVDAQTPASVVPRPPSIAQSAKRLEKPVQLGADLPPSAPVVALDGVCDPSPVSKTKGCRTVITRAQLDALIDTLAPGSSEAARRQFAINYARLLASSSVAQQEQLEKNPEVAKALEAQMRFARMQVLAGALYHQLEEHADNVPASEIEKYYADHLANFEQGEVERLFVPKVAPTKSGQPLDPRFVKAEADTMRWRAAAGEDLDQLQQVALNDLGIISGLPSNKRSTVRRTSLSADEAKVFDLNPGEVSPVLETPSALILLKLQSKLTLPAEDAQSEIRSILRRERLQQELENAAKSVKAQFNLSYLDMVSPPELFPLQGPTQPSDKLGVVADLRKRKASRRMPSMARSPGLTGLPQPRN
jgi:hypothetical protein